MRAIANDAASESAKMSALLPMPVPITSRDERLHGGDEDDERDRPEEVDDDVHHVEHGPVRQQAARPGRVEHDAEHEPGERRR